MKRLGAWLHGRTGYRAGLRRLLDEPLPAGTGWLFTLGSVLLVLLAIQAVTGLALTLYYAPTPDHAYDSIRFIDTSVPLGSFVRGLHHAGASFVVVFALLHLLRVLFHAAYKRPRELTWLVGVGLLLVVLAFALTGYLLPWDQRAYWGTVVTINIARLTPWIGERLAQVLQGGVDIGALTLLRWYAVHVVFLPAVLVALTIVHLVLMRRHGISGPIRSDPAARSRPFYPHHAARDVLVSLAVTAVLVAIASEGAPLESEADPTDASYIPRPEWYFLGLFELLKYLPGRWEIVGALVVPGLFVLLLALLPWLDRGDRREPRQRVPALAAVLLPLAILFGLTVVAWREPAAMPAAAWSAREIAGAAIVDESGCVRCHAENGLADELSQQPGHHSPDWLAAHVADPEIIAPGLREAGFVDPGDVAAVVAYVRQLRLDPALPELAATDLVALRVIGRSCLTCHRLDGDGGTEGPDLSDVGARHDQAWLRRWIEDPEAVSPDAEMPSFGNLLTSAELDAVAAYLAQRR